MARIAHLVFNTLQLMLAKPELVSMGSLIKQVHNKRHSIKVFWSPNRIGTDYRLQRKKMLQWWADYVNGLMNESKVIVGNFRTA